MMPLPGSRSEYERYLDDKGKAPSRNHLVKVCRSGRDTVSAFLSQEEHKVDQAPARKGKKVDQPKPKKIGPVSKLLPPTN